MTVAVPAIVKTWAQLLTTGTPGVRIPYVSLIDASQNSAYIAKSLLLANGGTVVWSASAGTGPASSSDHTDRIVNAAAFTPRATIAAASQAWVVILDGNGGQLLICFQGATDDIYRISYSHTAAFTLAGTTNQQPTAADELVMTAATTMVGSTTSQDRIVHGICTTDCKSYRFTVLRAGAIVGQVWHVETFTPNVIAPATVPLAVVVGGQTPAGVAASGTFFGTYTASTIGMLCRTVISSVQRLVQCCFSTICSAGIPITSNTSGTTKAELQGGTGFLPWPLWLVSQFASGQGLLGQLIDMYAAAPTSFVVGSGLGDQWWIQVGVMLWPNPSNVAWTLT